MPISDPSPPTPASPACVIPEAIAAVIASFEAQSEPFAPMDIHGALCQARQTLSDPSAAENTGAWAEVLAFGLAAHEHGERPWGTFFGPMGSMTDSEGVIHYSPDARQADATVLNHWKQQAVNIAAPVMASRYNDLVWDMSRLIAGERPDIVFAHRAIDSYLAAAQQVEADAHNAFPAAARALALAIQIRDTARRDIARAALLALHRKAMERDGLWWQAWNILADQSQAGLTDAERQILIGDLETVLARASDTATSGRFDPHHVESIANKLIPYYRRLNQDDDVRRLHLAVARAFEHFGSMGDALLASLVYQTSMEAYRQAGSPADETRLLRLIEASNVTAVEQMTPHEFRQEIPAATIETFLAEVILPTKEATFKRLAVEFLITPAQMEQSLQETARESPLSTFIPQSILSGNRVIAQIGTLDEDPTGHLIRHTLQHLIFSTAWLGWAIDRAREHLNLTADDVTSWANRSALFGDGALLKEGMAAWFAEDHLKAAHILIPQIEAAFRNMLSRLGQTTTKPHKQMRQARMLITLGDLLFHTDTATNLGANGPALILYLRCLYADPRGHNWRNDLAHGLLGADRIDRAMMLWVFHTLLLLGLWLEPRPESN